MTKLAFNLFTLTILGMGGCQASNQHASQSTGFAAEPNHYPPTYSEGHVQSAPSRYTSFSSTQSVPTQRSLQRPCGTFG